MTCNKNDFFTFLTSYNTKIEANEILYEGLICGKPSMKPVLKLNTKNDIFICQWHRLLFLKTSTKFETQLNAKVFQLETQVFRTSIHPKLSPTIATKHFQQFKPNIYGRALE